MVTLAGVFLVFCVCAIVASRTVPGLRMVGVIARSALVAAAGWVIWWGLLFTQVVRLDPLLRWLGLYRLEQPWAALLILGPPIVIAVAYGLVSARRARSGERRREGRRDV